MTVRVACCGQYAVLETKVINVCIVMQVHTAVVSVPASKKLKPSPERRYIDFSDSGKDLDSIKSVKTLPFSGWSRAAWIY
jgi:LysM repeat protein